jgi:TonB-dependent siderophore receptor
MTETNSLAANIRNVPLLTAMLFAGLPGMAQDLSISGTVRDADGVVPGAAITLRGASPESRSATTDAAGQYNFSGLARGRYELTFERRGFALVTQTTFVSAESRVVDATLTVGGVATSVDVIDVAGKATASRLDIPDRELPVQVSSIPQAVLEEQGANDLVTALRNASGVDAQRFYGVYEYYTIRGFHESDVELVDGMRLEGNRINTQVNSVESIEVLKGPSSILYGGQALSGAINIVRKKPQAQRAYDFLYRGGRFNTHQVAGGATGRVFGLSQLLYRTDVSYENMDGWRGAGSRRLNVSPSLTWLIGERSRITLHQSFNRDNFDGDGGVPVEVTGLPAFNSSWRFSTPWDFAHARDSQTNVLFNSNLCRSWEFCDGFFYRATNDQYFITEGLSYDPEAYAIDRYALYFQHHRRPKQNQADLTGRGKFLGLRHVLLLGYEYEDYFNYSDRTADGGDFFPTSISLATFKETQPPITQFDIVRRDYFANTINAFFWQDQISLGARVKINVGGRLDDLHRSTHNDPQSDGVAVSPGPEKKLDQTAYTYRAGIVYSPRLDSQLYFSSSSSFQPVTILPSDGKQLVPETGQNFEAGYRFQGGRRRWQINPAFYWLNRNDVVISRGMGLYDQAGRQSSRGFDIDFTGDVGYGIRAIVNYGYAFSKFDNYISDGEDLSGNRPRFTPRHTANAWLYKSWRSGFTAGAGVRYLGPLFTNDSDTIRLGGWTTFSGSFGYRRKAWEWSMNAENLLNRGRYFLGSDYEDQVYPGAPINVFTTIRFRFS